MLLLCCFLLSAVFSNEIFADSSGDKLDEWLKNPVGNPEEIGSLFEGDILLPDTNKRSGKISEAHRWPNKEIPYQFGNWFTYYSRRMIFQAMHTISKHTCIKFRPKTKDDKDYVEITSKYNGCFSFVGRVGGMQVLNLQYPGCLTIPGTAMHELLHVVGFYHEQSRHDRDEYVDVLWDNIEDGMKRNFQKYSEKEVTHFGLGYDYGSIMHYSKDAFSKNGKPTIVGKGDKKDTALGQRYSLTDLDAKKVNIMYNCTK